MKIAFKIDSWAINDVEDSRVFAAMLHISRRNNCAYFGNNKDGRVIKTREQILVEGQYDYSYYVFPIQGLIKYLENKYLNVESYQVFRYIDSSYYWGNDSFRMQIAKAIANSDFIQTKEVEMWQRGGG